MMEEKYIRVCRLSSALLLCALLMCFVCASADNVSHLDRRLRTIRYRERKDDTEQLEMECLNLIEDHNSPLEKGKIYSTMTYLYSDIGYGPDDDPNIAIKTFQYSMKALTYPLDPQTACYMYTRGSDAVVAQSWRNPEKSFLEIRGKAIELCLKGLKITLDNKAPKEYPQYPEIDTSISSEREPSSERLTQIQTRQIEAHEKWLYKTELYSLRQGLFKRCLSLNSHPVYHGIFKTKARKILKGHEETIEELLDALDIQQTGENTKATQK